MPSRAPTYFSWAHDKPCTTNQVYGFAIKGDMTTDIKTKDVLGPFDYVRPFSNCGFFPEISSSGGLVSKHRFSSATGASKSIDTTVRTSSAIRKAFNINDGYTSGGPDSIRNRMVKSQYPADVRLQRIQTSPPIYQHPVKKEKDIYLWHTLSGCLVHAKNQNENAVQIPATAR